MGLFLSFSIVLDSTIKESIDIIKIYSQKNKGGLVAESVLENCDPNFCSFIGKDKNLVITYPDRFTEYHQTSALLSKNLNSTVLTFTIHDGDFWMLYWFENGELISRFNSYPNYWSDEVEAEQMKSFNFDLLKLSNLLSCEEISIAKYFIEWKSSKRKVKAYKEDQYYYGDCFQLFDFLKKANVFYADIFNENKQGDTYKLYTEQFPLQEIQPEFNREEYLIKEEIISEEIRKARRYTNNYLVLSEAEIEYLLYIEPKNQTFFERVTKKQRCNKCHTYDWSLERLDMQCYLSINHSEVIDGHSLIRPRIMVNGYCSKCGKKMDSEIGIQNLRRLKHVLDSPYHLSDKVLAIIKSKNGINLKQIIELLTDEEKLYGDFETSKLVLQCHIFSIKEKFYPVIRQINFYQKNENESDGNILLEKYILVEDLRKVFHEKGNDCYFIKGYLIEESSKELFIKTNRVSFDFIKYDYYFNTYYDNSNEINTD